MNRAIVVILLMAFPGVTHADRFEIHGPGSSASGEGIVLALAAYGFLLYSVFEWWDRRARGLPMGQTESQWHLDVWGWVFYALVALGMSIPLPVLFSVDETVAFLVSFAVIVFVRQT